MDDPSAVFHALWAQAGPKAFASAVERAKQTRTEIVIEREGKIIHIPYDQIDAFFGLERDQT
jgi:hypothetical protein